MASGGAASDAWAADYCDQCSRAMMCLSVCLSVTRLYHTKMAKRIESLFWGGDSPGPKERCIRWGSQSPHGGWMEVEGIWCGLRQITLVTCWDIGFLYTNFLSVCMYDLDVFLFLSLSLLSKDFNYCCLLQIHQPFMIAALFTTAASFIIIFVAIKGYSDVSHIISQRTGNVI